ncbi:hypothetical protein GCM10007901_05840 [Dyella acidisoli]|uniref:Uncharacterized protein n=1 Tax=Dyella acidisoli TaxID=1867834 RepID=A0ABQ5XIX6_9GAMM|nr:hypothetical protein GCM10007901_05840 [Dyella acidisoli]
MRDADSFHVCHTTRLGVEYVSPHHGRARKLGADEGALRHMDDRCRTVPPLGSTFHFSGSEGWREAEVMGFNVTPFFKRIVMQPFNARSLFDDLGAVVTGSLWMEGIEIGDW